MPQHALVLVHRGSPTTARLVVMFRDLGIEPLIVSSAPSDDGAPFRELCEKLGVRYAVTRSVVPSADEIFASLAGAGETSRVCLAVWEGQRAVMAEINGRLGAIDVPPERVHAAQDKYLVRARLRDAGQSAIDSRRLDDPELRVRLERGERYIVKPRRGSGSLFTQPVSSFGEVEKLAAAFRRGTTAGDIYEEFFVDNELIAESYFDGREISLEMLRQGGRTLFVCEHEKSVLTLSASAVLERGLSSPAVGISAPDLARGTELATRTLDLLQLGDGCYHVELRMNDARQWEIIEVNPRIGGGFIFDSVRHQYDRSLVADWIEVLSGRPVPDIAPGPRRCGTYLQVNYAEAGRTIATLERNDRLPAPAMFIEVMKPGAVARGDREDIGAMSLWLTSLDTHSALVATLVANEYVTFQYR